MQFSFLFLLMLFIYSCVLIIKLRIYSHLTDHLSPAEHLVPHLLQQPSQTILCNCFCLRLLSRVKSISNYSSISPLQISIALHFFQTLYSTSFLKILFSSYWWLLKESLNRCMHFLHFICKIIFQFSFFRMFCLENEPMGNVESCLHYMSLYFLRQGWCCHHHEGASPGS